MRSLRLIAQELTRSDPGLLSGHGRAPAPRRLRAGPFGLAVASWCAAIGASALLFGPLPALVIGVVLAVTALVVGSSGVGHRTADG
ncbi:hypothetical protein LN037_13350 [Actinomycetospora sp. SF1]|nr:hypothetical protein [Actinomycetospora soli]